MGMALRITALVLIWIGATVAWVALGATLLLRTTQSDQAQRVAVGSLWGPEQTQSAPTFSATDGTFPAKPPDASRVNADLQLDQRRKGLLWYNTYRVDFSGLYHLSNTGKSRQLTFEFTLPAERAVYDDLQLLVNGRPHRLDECRRRLGACAGHARRWR